MARQLTLDLSFRPALGREDFLVAPSNAAAVAMVDEWPHWPGQAAIIVGPAGSGKSHLATVWQKRSDAISLRLADLTIEKVPAVFSNKAVVLEDASADHVPEQALFHLFNLARQQGGHLLLTAHEDSASWGISLPDLISRLRAVPVVAIAQPDDGLLRGVLVKLFADSQITVDEALVSFIINRMPRSLQAARDIVKAIDATALEKRAEITRPFVSRILAGYAEPQFLDDDGTK